MSENQNFGFGKFVPGFDFLQNLAQGASQTLPQMPNLSSWVAPTLNLEELEKRIGELKAVHFWLDQNSKALGATIQALEVQKMTLATLKGMNFSMADMANALQLKSTDGAGEQPPAGGKSKAARKTGAKASAPASGGVVDPLQWWGALTQQFQEIAAGAMKEAAAPTTAQPGGNTRSGAAGGAAHKTARKRPSKKTAG
jgi:hypothetical protein